MTSAVRFGDQVLHYWTWRRAEHAGGLEWGWGLFIDSVHISLARGHSVLVAGMPAQLMAAVAAVKPCPEKLGLGRGSLL